VVDDEGGEGQRGQSNRIELDVDRGTCVHTDSRAPAEREQHDRTLEGAAAGVGWVGRFERSIDDRTQRATIIPVASQNHQASTYHVRLTDAAAKQVPVVVVVGVVGVAR
jgi:hypothetical protein